MDEATRYAEERHQGAKAPLHRLKMQVKEWRVRAGGKFVGAAWNLVDTLSDAIRAGQYDVGMPLIYSEAIEVAGGASRVMVINVPAFGAIQQLIPFVTPTLDVPTEARVNAGIVKITIGTTIFYVAQNGTLMKPHLGGYTSGFSPVANGVGTAENILGYLRRIPVAQGDTIQVDIRNEGAEVYQVGLTVVQYGMLPPSLGRV